MTMLQLLKKPWGYHLIVDAWKCNPQSIRCSKTIHDFSARLVKETEMKAYGKPLIVRFGEDDKLGYTLVQLIETSNITAHFCEESNDAYIDIFSCKQFDPKLVSKTIFETFQPARIHSKFLKRNASA